MSGRPSRDAIEAIVALATDAPVRGLAPGADAWHALARRRHRSATRWARLVLAASKADDREEWRARAVAAEARVRELEAEWARILGPYPRGGGIAPGADAWHAMARQLNDLFWTMHGQREDERAARQAAEAEIERLRSEVAQLRAEDQATHYLLAEAEQGGCPSCVLLEAEVERLRAKLAAAREAWGKRSDLSWHSAFANGAVALRPDFAAKIHAALAPEQSIHAANDNHAPVVSAAYSMAPGPGHDIRSEALGLHQAVPWNGQPLRSHRHVPPDDLEARLVRLADEYAPESALSLYRGVAGTWTLEVCEWLGTELAGRERHVAGMASPSAAVAALEAQLEADRG